MPPHIKLNIPKPCHEGWQQMTPSEKGRFCGACAKEVVDFAAMSDKELLHYFLEHRGEKVCGRMHPEQLNRAVSKPAYPEKKQWWQWKYAAMLLVLLSRGGSSKAQGTLKAKLTAVQCPEKIRPDSAVNNNSRSRVVSGAVTDQFGNAVSFATVHIKGSNMGISADAAGKFSIKIKSEEDVLEISGIGFSVQQAPVKDRDTIAVVLQATKQSLGETVVVFTVGGISMDDNYSPANPNHTAILEVLDNATQNPVKAAITIIKNKRLQAHTLVTDKNGVYKLKHIKEYDRFLLRIDAEDYLPAEFEINGWEFGKRREKKLVYLEKAPVLADYKEIEVVKVVCDQTSGKRKHVTGAVITGVTIKRTFSDSLLAFKTAITQSLKIAPNPVAKGTVFTVQYAVKKAGRFIIRITDAGGGLVQQQPVMALQKNNIARVQTGFTWASGIYYLRMVDEKNNVLSISNFIVQ